MGREEVSSWSLEARRASLGGASGGRWEAGDCQGLSLLSKHSTALRSLWPQVMAQRNPRNMLENLGCWGSEVPGAESPLSFLLQLACSLLP